MFIGILSIIAAVVLSIISAVFSIAGIRTIFSGAILGATIMGSSMEFAKIVSTLWLYQFWKKSSKLLKGYLLFAVTILILISSIGIYGYLSKAYIAQDTPIITIENKIERIDLSIQREIKRIEQANTTIILLDESINKYIELGVVTKGLEQRTSQLEERLLLKNEINESEDLIEIYENNKLQLVNEINSFEANVGPIKYISILMYGEEEAETNYDNSARLLIILLVIVFDPFAVLLMVAGNIAIESKPKVVPKKPPVIEKKVQTVKKRKPVKKSKQTKKIIPNTMSKRLDTNVPVEENVNIPQESSPLLTPPLIHKKRKKVSL